jgi:multidrug resistance protein, MATE family
MTTDRATRNRMITALALPIVGGMISQNVLNLMDTGMVGRLGDDALAGVGVGGFANFTGVATVMGLSAGVQAIAARRFGAGETENTAQPLNAALVISVLVALPLSILLVWAAPYFFPYLNNDPAVIEQGVPYLQVRMLAMTAVGFNFAFRGYWNAINLPKLYLRTLVTMHILNIVLNWMFIFGNAGAPELGAMGAGLASAIATVGGAIYYIVLGLKYAKPHGFLKERPTRKSMGAVIKLAAPASLMHVTFAAGLTTLFWIIGQVGTDETAAATVLINIMLVAILPGLAFGLAAASLVGQALGRKDQADAMQWGWDVVRIGMITLGGLGLPMILFPEWMLGLFLENPDTVALAALPLRLYGGIMIVDAITLVLMNALHGAGASATVMRISVGLQWGLFLPCAYLAGPVMGGGLLAIWSVQIGYRIIQSVVFAATWKRGRWQGIEV